MSIEQMNSATLQALGAWCMAVVLFAGLSLVSAWVSPDLWHGGIRTLVFGAGALTLVVHADLFHGVRTEIERRRGLHPARTNLVEVEK